MFFVKLKAAGDSEQLSIFTFEISMCSPKERLQISCSLSTGSGWRKVNGLHISFLKSAKCHGERLKNQLFFVNWKRLVKSKHLTIFTFKGQRVSPSERLKANRFLSTEALGDKWTPFNINFRNHPVSSSERLKTNRSLSSRRGSQKVNNFQLAFPAGTKKPVSKKGGVQHSNLCYCL